MSIFNKVKNIEKPPTSLEIMKGRFAVNTSPDTISGSRQATKGVLQQYRGITDLYDKIEFMLRMNPDANMAHTSMLRLCYSGGETQFFNNTGKRQKKLETEWRLACMQMNKTSGDGLDGLINQFHNSLLKAGSLNFEVVVDGKADGISEVVILHPKYIEKEYDKTQQKYIDYQKYQSGKIQLTDKANYFSALFDAELGVPKGTLIYESAIAIIDTAWEFNIDLMAVVKRVGFPRNDISVDREAVLKSFPASVLNDPQKTNEAMVEYINTVKGFMSDLQPTQDTIHFDDTEVKNTSSDNSRTIDARAVWEIIDVQLLNGLGMMGIFLNRKAGVTETYGTVQFEIMLKTVASLQRISKRAVEYVAQIWLASKNIQGYAEYHHKPVDYKSEKQKTEIILDRQQIHRQAEEYMWEDKATAALGAMDIDTLPTASDDKLYQYVKSVQTAKKASTTDETIDNETTVIETQEIKKE